MPCLDVKVDNAIMTNCMCEYQSSVMQGIKFLLENESFTDCTLAAEGKFLNAHKLVLSACSSYFELLFSQQKEKYPIVFLKDVKFHNLKALIELLYDGRIQILEKEKDEFLSTVKALQIKGWKEKELGEEICSNHLNSSTNYKCHNDVQPNCTSEITSALEGKYNFNNSPCDLEDENLKNSEPPNLFEVPHENGFLNALPAVVGKEDTHSYNFPILCKVNEFTHTSKKLPSSCGSTGEPLNLLKKESPCYSSESEVKDKNCLDTQSGVQIGEEMCVSLLDEVFSECSPLVQTVSLSDTAQDQMLFSHGSSFTVDHESVKNGQRTTSPTVSKKPSLLAPLLSIGEGDYYKNNFSLDIVEKNIPNHLSSQNSDPEQRGNRGGYWSPWSSHKDSLCSHSARAKIVEYSKDLTFDESSGATFIKNNISYDYFSGSEKCTESLDEERIIDQSSCPSPVLSWHSLYLESKGNIPNSCAVTTEEDGFLTLFDDIQTFYDKNDAVNKSPVPHNDLESNFPSYPKNVIEDCSDNAVQKSLQTTSKRNTVSFPTDPGEKKEKHFCTICLLSFRSASKLKKHVKIHRRDAKFTCNVCSCTFTQDSDLYSHICNTPNEKFPCTKCTLKFFSKEELDKHARCHNQFKCEHCEAKLDSKMEVKSHLKIHSTKGPFKCLACGNEFQKRDDFIEHLREYEHYGEEENSNFTDLYCPLNKLEKRAGFWGGDGSFKCHSCNVGFSRRMILKEHIHTHMKENVLKCQKCDLTFYEKNVLYNHILRNSSRKPFRCQFCFAKFSLKKDHSTHYQIHLRNKENSGTVRV